MLLASLLLAQLAAAQPTPLGGARNPAYASDGRLAVAIEGDLYLRTASTSGTWRRLTAGPAWDREPAWSADGESLVFASNRGGGFDLWRIRVPRDAAGTVADGERLTSTADDDGEPSVAADGRIVFVRGRGSLARLWVRAADGAERRLTTGEATERAPAVSPDGRRVAYVGVTDAGRRLRIRPLDGGGPRADSVIVSDRNVEHPSWSPAGDRLAFTVAGARPGVFVTPPDGRYVNLVAARHAEPAWSPDGASIALADVDENSTGYNGDPARIADRDVAESFGARGGLYLVTAPVAPDEHPAEQRIAAERPRTERNAEAFDRAWQRSADIYFAAADATARRALWTATRDRYRPRAVAAASDDELQDVIYQALRERPPLREAATGRAAVSSAHPVATEAGLEILRKGGNVVDAAVAVSFALGVVEPDASGVGGYGQILVYRKGMDHPALFEFMSRVPEEATLANAALLMPDGRYPPDGPVLANVPGTVAGMHTAWKKFGSGKVPWADLLAPAIRAAKNGYPVSDGLATTLMVEREQFAKYESSRALFFRDGKPLVAGDTLRNPDLAWVLEQIAKNGADGFYKGEVARRMIADLRGKGNAMRLTDLARYYAAEREPVRGTFRQYTFWSSAPPSAGGATLAAQLSLLEQWQPSRSYRDDPATLHAMIAAWQLVPSGRGRIADPGLWPVNIEPFTNKDTAKVRWKCFDPAHALNPSLFRGDTLTCGDGAARKTASALGAAERECDSDQHAAQASACRATGTTAFVVADAEGNAVAATQTLGTWGGTFYVSPGLGFIYNDKLTSYGTDPNQYGARLPFARHGSTLAPTIAFKGTGAAQRPVLAVGAAGNAWITSAVYETLVGVLDHGLTPQQALEQPRFLPSGRGGGAGGAPREVVIDAEDGFAPSTVRKLRQMGYTLNFISLPGELRMGYGAAVTIGDRDVVAGADPRRSGTAGAVK